MTLNAAQCLCLCADLCSDLGVHTCVKKNKTERSAHHRSILLSHSDDSALSPESKDIEFSSSSDSTSHLRL